MRSLPRFLFSLVHCARISCFVLLCAVLSCKPGNAQTTSTTSPQVSNATPHDLSNIELLLAQLDAAIGTRYPNALQFYGLSSSVSQYSILTGKTQITHVAAAPGGALVRLHYAVHGKSSNSSEPVLLKSGTLETWLMRQGDGFAFTNQVWHAPDPPETVLVSTARQAWQDSSSGILHLIVDRHGGRWIPLRQMRWRGNLASARVLTQLEGAQQPLAGAANSEWIIKQLERSGDLGAGTLHLFLQAGSSGWVGIGSAWHGLTSASGNAENELQELRKRVNGDDFVTASAHHDFGKALASAGLFAEAVTQLEQASALAPSLVDASFLDQVKQKRHQDPETLAANQLQNEARIGLDPAHPTYQISALTQQFSRNPTPLAALRLGVDYSQLGDDNSAAQMLQQAQGLLARQDIDEMDPSDRAWVKVLLDHLQERTRDAAIKPPNLIRSSLFTVRCWIDDPNTLPLLAALEDAQHTVYADFTIPMNNTEVLLWPTQSDFQRYTTRFSDTAHSEFVTALTLTKLIGTRQGPMVLGEEMNMYTSRNTTWFSTIAHEYGHVAVRQMSRARDVPTWLNEGIACVVEGGYEGYLPRIRRAAQSNTLLSMSSLLEWNVDGERAFLAYSQANSMVDYIIKRWGGNALLQILRLIGSDMSADDAFVATLQLNQNQLWQEWRRNGVV